MITGTQLSKPCLTPIPNVERPRFLIQANGNNGYILRNGLKGPDGSIIGRRRQAPWQYEANRKLREAQRESEEQYLGSRHPHHSKPASDPVLPNDKIVVNTIFLKGARPKQHPSPPAPTVPAAEAPVNGHKIDHNAPAAAPAEAATSDTLQ